LSKAYNTLDLGKTKTLSNDEAQRVLDAYMKFYLLSDSLATKLPDDEMSEVFPGWQETQTFTRDVLKELTRTNSALDFSKMTQVVEEIGERFGQFQDGECKQMKSKLIALGDQGIGRVPLPDFYRSSLNGTTFEFQESPAYLKELGVLDDSENVIVPNYVGSHTNCIASSNLYSVCCIDECEQLMGQIEREISAPEAIPSAIISLVSGISSSTVDAPRQLPRAMMNRLHDIAIHNGGEVPLHGRMFAQWLHFAFPQECAYPAILENAKTLAKSEWHAESYAASSEERVEHLLSAEVSADVAHDGGLDHWFHDNTVLVDPDDGHHDVHVWLVLPSSGFGLSRGCICGWRQGRGCY